jgi:hypothetical protein
MAAKRPSKQVPAPGASERGGPAGTSEERSFAGSPPGHASDSGDPASASAYDTEADPAGHERMVRESHDFAQLGLSRSSDDLVPHDPALQGAGVVDDEAWAAPAVARSLREPMDEQDLNDIAADDVGASAFAERTQKEAER